MPLITPDFTDVKDDIKAGTYSARVIEGKLGEWSNGGKYVKWVLETCAEADPKNNGRRIYHNTPIAGGGAFRLKELYTAAMRQDIPQNEGFDAEMLYGKEVKVIVVDGVNYKTGEPSGYPEVKKVTAL